jgi:glycerophosphoryl diester phosphodiesterase
MLFKTLHFTFLSVMIYKSIYGQPDVFEIMNKYPVKVIAHRGASGHAPENTFAAFRKALDIGANYIELDVHLSKDGEVVVIHDATLNRTTNGGKGKVCEKTLAELRQWNATAHFGQQYPDEKIPLLLEVLQFVKGKAILLIEIKADSRGRPYPAIENKILQIIKEHDAENWCEIQSFYDFYINGWKKLNSNIPVHKLLAVPSAMIYVDHKLRIGNLFRRNEHAQGINAHHAFVTKRFFKKIHKQQHSTYIWTVNKQKDMERILKYRPDGIITNYPDRLLKLLQRVNSP